MSRIYIAIISEDLATQPLWLCAKICNGNRNKPKTWKHKHHLPHAGLRAPSRLYSLLSFPPVHTLPLCIYPNRDTHLLRFIIIFRGPFVALVIMYATGLLLFALVVPSLAWTVPEYVEERHVVEIKKRQADVSQLLQL